jgi:crotonobetaine/carnitine-CoA ligase
MDTESKMLTPLEVLRCYPAHDGTVYGAFRSRADVDPDRELLVFEGRRWSWREFDEAVLAAARLFVSRGIRQGDRVGVMARNSDRQLLLLLSLARIGAIMVPVNPDFRAAEAGYAFERVGVAAVACDAERLSVVREACRERGLDPWLVTLDRAADGVPDIAELMRRAGKVELPERVDPDATCLIIFTSGTTGFPKGAMHSQRNYVTAGEAFVQRMHLEPQDRVMVVLPMFHINALFYSVAGALAAGAALIVVPKFSASRFWVTACETGATQCNIMEAAETILTRRPRSEFRSEHKLCKVYGVRPPASEIFRSEFGIPHLITGYGMTEIPGTLSSPFAGLQKEGSMGVLGRHPDPARPWAECRVVDDEGRDVGTDEVGELLVKTPIIMQGYWGDSEGTAAAFRDGWFVTSDLVRRDADGYFYFVSRKKDIIRRRGENIAAAEIERVIDAHPGVLESAAIAVDAELGEEILAVIVARPGASPSADDIARWCGERLSAMKVPRFILFVDELPHTPTHKLAKVALRADPTLKERATDFSPPSADWSAGRQRDAGRRGSPR